MGDERKRLIHVGYKILMFFLPSSLFSRPSILYACPLCNEAVAKMGQIWTSLGFNWSIYLMIAVPFILVGSFVVALIVISKKNAKRLDP